MIDLGSLVHDSYVSKTPECPPKISPRTAPAFPFSQLGTTRSSCTTWNYTSRLKETVHVPIGHNQPLLSERVTLQIASPQTSFGVRLSRIQTNPKGRLWGGYLTLQIYDVR